MRELRKVKMKGRKELFYQDFKLEEFRSVDNPHDRISFEEYFGVST